MHQIPFTKRNGRKDNWNTRDSTVSHVLVYIDEDGGHFMIADGHSEEEALGKARTPRVRRALEEFGAIDTYVLGRDSSTVRTIEEIIHDQEKDRNEWNPAYEVVSTALIPMQYNTHLCTTLLRAKDHPDILKVDVSIYRTMDSGVTVRERGVGTIPAFELKKGEVI